MHRKSREAAEALRNLEQTSGRDAKASAVAAELGIDIRSYHTILTESSAAHVFSFDQPDEHTGETMSLPQSAEASPGETVEYQSFRRALALAIKNLPERECLVMSLYYDEDLNLREIGEILGGERVARVPDPRPGAEPAEGPARRMDPSLRSRAGGGRR